MPKTSKRQVLAVYSLDQEEWLPVFIQPHPTFPELLLGLSARDLCSWYIFLQGTCIFSLRDRTPFSVKGLMLPLYINSGQQRAPQSNLCVSNWGSANTLAPRKTKVWEIFFFFQPMTKTGAVAGMGSAKRFALHREVLCKEKYFHPQMSVNFLLVLLSNLK